MGVHGLPTLYFINADGTVFRKMEVELPDGDLRAGFNYLKVRADSSTVLQSSEKH